MVGVNQTRNQPLSTMRRAAAALMSVVLFLCVGAASTASAQGVLLGGPCEGCEAVFEYRDVADRPLTPVDTLPGFADAEQKLLLRGRIFEPDGETPAEGIILYIYHTNADGEYATRGDEEGWGRRHGYIRGWIKTAADGQYAFYTRMPGSYSSNPAHIHPTVLEPDGRYYYVASWFFEGDPNYDERHHSEGDRGGSGLVAPFEEDGLMVAERDIVLGLNVPGYDNER